MSEKLWAPWRASYLTDGPREGCFLCRAWESPDPEAHRVVWKGERAFVIMNLFPYNNGHLMVACAEHVADLEQAGAATRAEVMELVNRAALALRRAFGPDGMNIGINLGKAAGAGLADHLHVHLVPRWAGDTNFMPVLGEIKVVSEHLDASYAKVRECF